MTWRKRYRRLKARVRAALDGWRSPYGHTSFQIENDRADWSREVNFTRNQSVLRIFVVADNELLREGLAGDEMIADRAAQLARTSAREYIACLS